MMTTETRRLSGMASEKTKSKFFSTRQLMAVNKIGDAIIVSSGEFPSFSQLGCVSGIDRVLTFMPEGDRKDLAMLLSLLSFVPVSLLRIFFVLLEFLWEREFPMPGVLRLIRLGLRGVVMSLYYGDEVVHQKMNYQVGVYVE